MVGPYDTGMLAPSPVWFNNAANCGAVTATSLEATLHVHGKLDSDFAVTNHGIRIRAPIYLVNSDNHIYLVFIGCGHINGSGVYAVPLRLMWGSHFTRIRYGNFDLLDVPYATAPAIGNIFADRLFISVRNPTSDLTPLGFKSDIDIQPLLDVCKARNLTVHKGSNLSPTSKSFCRLNVDFDKTIAPSNRKCFILANETMQAELVIALTLNMALLGGWRKNCVALRVFTVGSTGDIPEESGQSLEDIRAWFQRQQCVDWHASSHFALAKWPSTSEEITFMLICEEFVKRHDTFENRIEGRGKWRLLAIPQPSEDSSP